MKLFKVAIHGVPRSGTTWLGAIFDSSEHVIYRNQPLFSYRFKSFLTETSTRDDINNFFDQISASNDDFLVQKEARTRGLIPVFKKEHATHVIYKETRYHNLLSNMISVHNDIKFVGIVRNPKAVIYSWYNAPKEFDRQHWNLLDQWEEATLKNNFAREQFYGYKKWKEVALLFMKLKSAYPDQFYMLRYDDLINNTEQITWEMFDFCQLDFSAQTRAFLSESRTVDGSDEAYSVYRDHKSDNRWVNKLPGEISRSIDRDLKGTGLEMFLS